MINNIDVVGSALKILIEFGELAKADYLTIYEYLTSDHSAYEALNTLCQQIGLYLTQQSGVLYVSPIPGITTFSHTNKELREEIKNWYDNKDVCVLLFITATIVTEFFPEAALMPSIPFLKINRLMNLLDQKIDILYDQVNLEEISYKNSYNFEVVVKKWKELPRIKVDAEDVEGHREFGKKSKIQFVNTTLKFLIDHKLIKVESVYSDRLIYITPRFKATVHNIFNNEQAQLNIYDIIEGFRGDDTFEDSPELQGENGR